MEGRLLYEGLAILLLILANGFFALSEFSVIASRKTRLRQKAKGKESAARVAEELNRNPESFLATVQVGITLLGTLAGVFGGSGFVSTLESQFVASSVQVVSDWARPLSLGVVALAISISSVILGELIPKYLALANPEGWAILVAHPIRLFIRCTSFFSNMLSGVAAFIIRLFGVKRSADAAITGEEINLMLLEGKNRGVFDETEEKLVKSVFEFSESTVRRVMTPRTDVVGIDVSTPADQIIHIITEHGYSRYPVYDGVIDNIVGVLYTKDLIYNRMDPYLIVLGDLIRKPMFVPETMELSRLLNEFQRKKVHIAIALDEFGGTAGVVTIEDILEEIVGEIQDEYDMESTPLVKQSETVAFADGMVWPGDVNSLLKTNLRHEEVDTMAGLVIDHLGRVPETHESCEIDGLRITVLKKEKNRLTRLKLERTSPIQPELE